MGEGNAGGGEYGNCVCVPPATTSLGPGRRVVKQIKSHLISPAQLSGCRISPRRGAAAGSNQQPMASEVRQQAQAEKQTLLVAENKTGYFGVSLDPRAGRSKPYQARVWRGGKLVSLGYFATAGEAALCVAQSPEGQAVAAERAAAAAPLTSEEARQQAQAEKLTLLVADNKTGYYGDRPANPKPYQAGVRRGGTMVSLGCFATAEEAALSVARSPEGQVAAVEWTIAAPPLQPALPPPAPPAYARRTAPPPRR